MYVEMDNGGQFTIDMVHPLITSVHVSLYSPLCGLLYRGFCVLGNDFSSLWPKIRSGLFSLYVSYLNFIGGNKSGLD